MALYAVELSNCENGSRQIFDVDLEKLLVRFLQPRIEEVYQHDCALVVRVFQGRKHEQEYGVTNLWKVDLSEYWRMIYTLKQPQRKVTEIEIIEIWLDVLDVIGHKNTTISRLVLNPARFY